MSETTPGYVYVASSWRNPHQQSVVEALRVAGISCYDFKNPDGGSGFSWKQVKTEDGPESFAVCEHCAEPIIYSTFGALAWEPDYDPDDDPVLWRHKQGGYAACGDILSRKFAAPKKGSDYEATAEYLQMIDHPRALEGFAEDFAAMVAADTFVLVLPCGKSAHLELGWAVGAGKRTAILLEDPMEPELMYRMVDHLAPSLDDLLAWLAAVPQESALAASDA